ncbi:MAG: hypothetical protein IT184_09775 [Acidobacteria bacterium]|nr:hypothetical protein [Acidobacteriota bacterium]
MQTAVRSSNRDQASSTTGSFWPWLAAIALVALVFVAFQPALDNPFVDWDDEENFVENPYYKGFGWSQIWWAWTGVRVAVYQPLAWMLLSAQYVVWGLDARGYHLVSLLIYAANTVLLFALVLALLRRAHPIRFARHSGLAVMSAATAVALFAVHPLRVEPVAWASCQPYLPSAFFYLLSLHAYLRAFPDQSLRRPGWFWTAFACMIFGVLSKAVAVTVPFALLLLDFYPLRRVALSADATARTRLRRAIVEKWPFFAVSVLFMAIATIVKPHEPLVVVDSSPYLIRIVQSAYAIWFYLTKSIAPSDISAFYGNPRATFPIAAPFWLALVAAVAVTSAALRLRARYPAFSAAWLGYLVILAPNLGLVKITTQVATDRYGYVATMPLAAGLAGIFWFLLTGSNARRLAVPTLAVAMAVVPALVLGSRGLSRTWSSSETLWRHALDHGGHDVPEIHSHLGAELVRQDRLAEARIHLEESVRLAPNSSGPQNNFGVVLARVGMVAEAEKHFVQALRINPLHDEARANLGAAMIRRGAIMEGLAQYVVALESDAESSAIPKMETLLAMHRRDLAPSIVGPLEAVVDAPHDAGALARLRDALGPRVAEARRVGSAPR